MCLLDLPPGTGDIAISMAQLLPNAELVLISPPQHAAVDVAERAGTLSLQTGQKVVGVVENMAAMTLPDGTVLDMFGSGGGQVLAERLSEALLPGTVARFCPVGCEPAYRRRRGYTGGLEPPELPTAEEIQSIASQLLQSGESRAGQSLPLFV